MSIRDYLHAEGAEHANFGASRELDHHGQFVLVLGLHQLANALPQIGGGHQINGGARTIRQTNHVG